MNLIEYGVLPSYFSRIVNLQVNYKIQNNIVFIMIQSIHFSEKRRKLQNIKF